MSLKYYSEKKEIDFFYYDLSKGGKAEKETGADLGFILVIDLPDYPFLVKSFIFQAKKINKKVQIDKEQYLKLEKNSGKNAYLFYDIDLSTLSSPLVLEIDNYRIKEKKEESDTKNTESFYLDFKDIQQGSPLSLFITQNIMKQKFGKQHSSFKNSLKFFNNLCDENQNAFNGIVGVVSLGKKINYDIKHNEGLDITI